MYIYTYSLRLIILLCIQFALLSLLFTFSFFQFIVFPFIVYFVYRDSRVERTILGKIQKSKIRKTKSNFLSTSPCSIHKGSTLINMDFPNFRKFSKFSDFLEFSIYSASAVVGERSLQSVGLLPGRCVWSRGSPVAGAQ